MVMQLLLSMESEQECKQYFETVKSIQRAILEFVDTESESQLSFDILINLIKDKKFQENKHNLKFILHLLVNISNNHHRYPNFFTKIEQILFTFAEEIKRFYSNNEIFHIFKTNKRILLFVIEAKILTVDESITKLIEDYKYKDYRQYFMKEIKPFLKPQSKKSNTGIIEKLSNNLDENPNEHESTIIKGLISFLKSENEETISEFEKDPIQFEKNRHIGENDSEICILIRNDSIDEFIFYFNSHQISQKTEIPYSIYETNQYLMKNKPSLIEYAAFYGSIQIFKYLLMNNAILNSPIWDYAVHGRNPEIIHIIEEKQIEPPYCSYDTVQLEAVKCHHNELAKYINDNYMQVTFSDDEEFEAFRKMQIKKGIDLNDEEEEDEKFYGFSRCYKWYNLDYVKFKYFYDQTAFFYLCKYDLFYFVNFLLQAQKIDINMKII